VLSHPPQPHVARPHELLLAQGARLIAPRFLHPALHPRLPPSGLRTQEHKRTQGTEGYGEFRVLRISIACVTGVLRTTAETGSRDVVAAEGQR
jgi:hypothetical protein